MTATVIDGKRIASEIHQEVSLAIKTYGLEPKLAVILVGKDPASQVYVKRKRKVCEEIGICSELHEFPADVSQQKLEDFIGALRCCTSTDGILVQLPLPTSLDKDRILNAVPPEMDVDCFSAMNVGHLAQGKALLKPCTPAGILEILKYHQIPTQGRRVTIINRSQVVGQPLALVLQQDPYNSTVTVCHEHTETLPFHTLYSDIVITAVGKYPKFQLPADWLPQGGTVIDVAMNRVDGKLFGDVADFEAAKERVQFITPVPGGVGPLTVAMLMKNTLIAAKLKRNLIGR